MGRSRLSLWVQLVRPKRAANTRMELLTLSLRRKTERPTETSRFSRNEDIQVTLTRVASDLTAPHKAANSKSSKKKPYMWANTIWVTVTTPSKFSSPFKSKCVTYHFYTITTIFLLAIWWFRPKKWRVLRALSLRLRKARWMGCCRNSMVIWHFWHNSYDFKTNVWSWLIQ